MPPYLARQMSRVETRTPGETDVVLPDLFGSGVRAILAIQMDTEFYLGSGHRKMEHYILHV